MEFELDGHTYRVGKMNAMGQFHLARRLMPLLAAAGAGAMDQVKTDPFAAMASIAESVASLPDAEAEYIISAALGIVQRRAGEAWAKVWSQSGGLMFEDISLSSMLQIVGRSLGETFGGFFAVLPPGSGQNPNP